jgi:predicted Zn-dependent peptidase
VTARPGISAEQLEQDVAHEIDIAIRDGIREEEVNRAIALIQTDFVTSMQSAGDRADRLSLFATYFGNPELVNEQVDGYRAVSTNDVNEFVQARLGEDNRASLLYVPRADTPGELVGAGSASEVQ